MRIHQPKNELMNGEKNISYSKKIILLTDRMSNLEKDMLEIQNRNKAHNELTMKKAKSKENLKTYTENNLYKKPNIESMKHIIKKNKNLNNQKSYSTMDTQTNIIYCNKDYLKNKSQSINNLYEDLYEEDNTLYKINQQRNQRLLTINNEEIHHNKMKTLNNNYEYFNEKSQNNLENQNKIINFISNKKDDIKDDEKNLIPSEISSNTTNNSIKLITGFTNELDYEFEIMHLKKRLKSLKDSNENLNEKLRIIKKENEGKNLKKLKSEKKIKKNENIISNVISIYKNNNINIKSIFYESENNYKHMLLSLMELKFEYENYLLVSSFYDGINNLLFKNESKVNSDIIYNKINSLIKNENKSQNKINEFENPTKEDEKYFKYCRKLCYDLDFSEINLAKLKKYINNIIVSNKKENIRIKKLKKVLSGKNQTLLSNFKSNVKKKEKDQKKNFSFDESETTLKNLNNELIMNEKHNTIVRNDENFKRHNAISIKKNKKSKLTNYYENEDTNQYKTNKNNSNILRKNKNLKIINGKLKMNYYRNNTILDDNYEKKNDKINKKNNDEFSYSTNTNKPKTNTKKNY